MTRLPDDNVLRDPRVDNTAARRPRPFAAMDVAARIVALRDLPAIADPRQDALRESAAGPDPVRAVLALPGLARDPCTLAGPVADAHRRIDRAGIAKALTEAR